MKGATGTGSEEQVTGNGQQESGKQNQCFLIFVRLLVNDPPKTAIRYTELFLVMGCRFF